ncbi:helix-turn-helix domain-containing protein [Lactococcus garvieae]|uniref:helix-turn-helix domain-containing protein n=1 Tax=Lactococcus garvieae TaxID=1363 RepID=UPI003D171205
MGMEYFGEKLKAVRKSKGLTQLELAKRLNASKGAISAYEQGITYPSVDVLIKICDILDTSSDYLLGISDEVTIKMSGLSEKQMESFLEFVAIVEQANNIVEEKKS